MEDIDYSLISKDLMEESFPEDGPEQVLFMAKCKKFNRHGMSQDRVFVLSTTKVSLFSPKKMNTCCNLASL